jgi:hypothetical protein
MEKNMKKLEIEEIHNNNAVVEVAGSIPAQGLLLFCPSQCTVTPYQAELPRQPDRRVIPRRRRENLKRSTMELIIAVASLLARHSASLVSC